MEKCKCLHCDHEWVARTDSPRGCPNCFTRKWNQPRKRKMKDPNDYIIEGSIVKIGCYRLDGEFRGYAIIDTEDIEKCKPYKWCIVEDKYVVAKPYGDSNGTNVKLHNIVMDHNSVKNENIDHIDNDGLNNRKSNLRVCNHSENLCNKHSQKNNTSGYKGVSWQKNQGYWSAKIQKDRKKYHLGFFDDPWEAAQAYNLAALELHGEFAKLNIRSV